MATQHQSHERRGNSTRVSCSNCRPDPTSRCHRYAISVRPNHRRALIYIAAVTLVSMAMPHGSASAVAASLPIEAKSGSLRSNSARLPGGEATPRRLQVDSEEGLDDHDHGDEDHGDEDHGDEEDDHADHDHGDVVEEVSLFDGSALEGGDHSDHDGHDEEHSNEHDDHSDHDDHDDNSSHDDHSGHADEGSFYSFSSANESAEENLPWGAVIGSTLLVNLASLSGCLILIFAAMQQGLLKLQGKTSSGTAVGHGLFFDICIPAFAVGALIATAVFLIFPEALHLIEGGHSVAEEAGAEEDHSDHGHRYLQEDSHAGHDDSSESANAAKFGCAILGGFLLPFVFSIFLHHSEPDDNVSLPPETSLGDSVVDGIQTGVSPTGISGDLARSDEAAAEPVVDKSLTLRMVDDEDPCDLSEKGAVGDSQQESITLVKKTFINKQLCASILLGDAFHNFADGVFIGAAFKSCSTGTAISIILVTLFHEIAQELADFVLLTRYAGLSITRALALNFLSGLSVCLGGIIFLASNPSDLATGVILAIAGGVYFNIAGCETIPRIDAAVKSRMNRVWTLLSIIVGTVPIGLILLNHQHCG